MFTAKVKCLPPLQLGGSSSLFLVEAMGHIKMVSTLRQYILKPKKLQMYRTVRKVALARWRIDCVLKLKNPSRMQCLKRFLHWNRPNCYRKKTLSNFSWISGNFWRIWGANVVHTIFLRIIFSLFHFQWGCITFIAITVSPLQAKSLKQRDNHKHPKPNRCFNPYRHIY